MIHGFVSAEALALLFIFFGLAIAVVIKKLKKRFALIPYAPTLFFISMALGYFSKGTGIIGDSIQQISKTDPRGILLIFLPPLIFESSFNSDWYIFRKQSVQIFILAFPAVLCSALFIMFSVKQVVGYGEDYYTWPQAFMFGSVLSCTDTVAVLALLKEAGAPRKFSSLIEGQSLFNDGTCMVLFTISLQLVGGNSPHILNIVQLFLELTIGAIALGIIFGYLSSELISKVSHNAILTLNITVVSCYIIYFVAEYVDMGIKISGIMSLVSLGLYMAAFGKTKIATQSKHIVHNFWKIYIFVAQTIIFILGGVLVGVQALRPEFVQVISVSNLIKLGSLYLCMTLARFFSIAIFMPKLQTQGYGLKWKQVIALTYGGLRGAVGIAFTLILASDHTLRISFRTISLFNTSGCAILTLLINAPTTSFIVRKLGLCVKSQIQMKIFRKFMRETHSTLVKSIKQDMKNDKYLSNSKWDEVDQYSGIIELSKLGKEETRKSKRQNSEKQMKEMNSKSSLKDSLIRDTVLLDNDDKAIIQQVRHRFCLVVKGIMWDKFQSNQCSSQSIRALNECVNLDMDSIEEPLNSWDYLISHLNNKYFFAICYWLKGKPLIGPYAYSWIYDRVRLLYDVISTYIESLREAQQACEQFPFGRELQEVIVQQSIQNRKLAETFLDCEIKLSYEQIMKRIQTTKAAYSIITFQKENLRNSYQFGEIDDIFHKKLSAIINKYDTKLENDSILKQPMKDIDFLKANEFFSQIPDKQLYALLAKKNERIMAKDQPIAQSYEKQKHIYLVTRGQIREEYRKNKNLEYQRNVGLYQLSAVGLMLNSNKKLEYSGIAASSVNLFCFQMTDIRKIIDKNPKLQAILYLDIFLLQSRVQPTIFQSIRISEEQWRQKRHEFTFYKIAAKQSKQFQYGKIFLLSGNIDSKEKQIKSGYIQIKQKIKINGPAKLYFTNAHLKADGQLQEHRDSNNFDSIRNSASKRLSNARHNNDDIIRRTIFTKD